MRTFVNSVAVAFTVVLITFFLVRWLLGNPAWGYAMTANGGLPPTPAEVHAAQLHLGISGSALSQLGQYLSGLAHGNLGISFEGAQLPVATLIWGGFQNTLVLSAMAVVVSLLVGTAVGLALAMTPSRGVNGAARAAIAVTIAMPPVMTGLLLVWLAVALHGTLPAGGWGNGYPANFRYLILPTLALCIGFGPALARVVRERALAVLAEPHIDAARARGVPPLQLALRHVLPECVVPLIRFLALGTAGLLSGAVVVENVFAIPGIGTTLTNAVNADDFPVIQGCVMLTGFVVVICLAIAQIAGAAIDPRTRI